MEQSDSIESEIVRRHKATATTVAGLLVLTVLLLLVAYLGSGFIKQQPNPALDMAVRITILIIGVGSIALRRTRFSTMRLRDIGALRGVSGLLKTLERTTIQVALLGAAVAAIGFAATIMTGNNFYTYGSAAIGTVVLLYSYPSRRAWRRTVAQFTTEPEVPTSDN